jgi:hypothetical protein
VTWREFHQETYTSRTDAPEALPYQTGIRRMLEIGLTFPCVFHDVDLRQAAPGLAFLSPLS